MEIIEKKKKKKKKPTKTYGKTSSSADMVVRATKSWRETVGYLGVGAKTVLAALR